MLQPQTQACAKGTLPPDRIEPFVGIDRQPKQGLGASIIPSLPRPARAGPSTDPRPPRLDRTGQNRATSTSGRALAWHNQSAAAIRPKHPNQEFVPPMIVINKKLLAALAAVLVMAGAALFMASRAAQQHPFLHIDADDGLTLTILQRSAASATACEGMVSNFSNGITSSCPKCRIRSAACLKSLDEAQGKYLSPEPIDAPSVAIANGVIVFQSADRKLAMTACEGTARATAATKQPVTCFAPGAARPAIAPAAPAPFNAASAAPLAMAMLLLGLTGVVSLLTNYLIVRYEDLHSRWSHDHLDTGPQKFHETPTPRIGGVGIFVSLLVGSTALLALQSDPGSAQFGLLLLASLPAFAGGLAEDLLKSVGVRTRLVMTMLSGAAAAWLLGGIIPRLDIPFIDELMTWAPLAIALSIFAVAGFANATNIIDGYNGLASGYAMIVLAAISIVAHQVGDGFILCAALAMLGAQIGFFAWNYPHGKIFLGDGGAYLLGFWIAELSVLLVARHAEVSPWFSMVLLVYPTFETLFSSYRRALRRHSPGHPDALHLHHLIFRRVLLTPKPRLEGYYSTVRNSQVAKYLWGFTAAFAVPSIFWFQKTAVLFTAVLAFVAIYMLLYEKIVTFKTPQALIPKPVRKANTQCSDS